ncbi:hypothetical protein RJ639_021322 [Escallonia herrerae]|uniref:Uncharacterized protein n=1 Tax=Escallonia herrerae TaxID=1293975 RepID=A0AA88V388_9ASTE|nr:hypothetical protein RJ639_021322 [Escallonia herrerae]
MLNEADELARPKSIPTRTPSFWLNRRYQEVRDGRSAEAVRYGRSAEAKEPEAVETEMQAEVAQDERKMDESKKKMNEIDESTLPNSLPTRTSSFRHNRRYRPVSVDCAIVISPRKQSLTYKQCGFDGLSV